MKNLSLYGIIVFFLIAGFTLLLPATAVRADVPHLIQYQGRLTDNAGNPLDTTVDMTFAVYNDSLGSVKLWEEVHPDVTAAGGLFDVLLGQTTIITKTVFDGSKRWLGISIDGGAVMQPMTPIVSSGYAFRSQYSDTASYATNARHADTAAVALNAGSNGWIDAGNEVYLSTLTDSVGIGVTNPGAPLEVEGPAGHGHAIIGNSHGSGTAAGVFGANDSDGFGIMGVSTDGRGVTGLSMNGFGGHFYGVKNYFNKDLGIGTETPTEMLHIYSNSSGTDAKLRIQSDHATNWGEVGLQMDNPAASWKFLIDDASGDDLYPDALGLYNNIEDDFTMIWREDGRVGIGSMSANHRLSVSASGHAILGYSTGTGAGIYGLSESGYGGYFSGPKHYFNGLTGFYTTNPTHRVTVNGAIGIQQNGTTKFHLNYYNNGFNISETTVADYRLYVKEGGNVGIGTSNPTTKLHVAGTLHADAFEADAIGRENIRDEVGVAYASSASHNSLTTSWVPYLTKQITIPTDGYILAIGSVVFYMEHGVSGSTRASAAFSDLPDDINGANEYRVLLFSSFDAGTMIISTPCQRLFYKSAGTYTFYMLASRWPDNPASIYDRDMALIFLPTPYGSKAGVISTDPADNIAAAADGAQNTDLGLLRASESSDADDEAAIENDNIALSKQIEALTSKLEALEGRLQAVENK